MSFIAFVLIAGSVLLHVSWNFISKASKLSGAFYLVTVVYAVIFSAPCLWYSQIHWRALPAEFWWYLFWTSVANVVYYTGLFLTYQKSDISLAYPMVRALPVILTAVVTSLLGIGTRPSPLALLGMFIVFCGCLMMPLKKLSDFSLKNYMTPILKTIVLAAIGTTGYTIFDSLAISLLTANAGASKIVVCGGYMCMMEFMIALGMLPFLCFREEREHFRALLRNSWAPGLSGLFTVGAYMLVLLAMPLVTNVSFVQVFRQMGLPVGVIAGVLLLKEQCSRMRLIGMLVIVAGLIVVALG